MVKVFPTTRAELVRTVVLLSLLTAAIIYPFAARGPCQFPNAAVDRAYDFRVRFDSFTLEGNSGNYFDYLILFSLLMTPWDWAYDFTVDFYGMKYEGNTGDVIDRVILVTGSWELPVLHLLRDVTESLAPEKGVFLDVGANTGQHSLFMSRFCSTVFSIEPYPPALVRLRKLIESNQIRNIVICPVGLGNRHAKIPFWAPPDWNQGQGSFLRNFSSENRYQAELEIVVGDELLKELGDPPVHTIKIDVEGFERAVLEGLENTLQVHRPVVVVEVTPGLDESFTDVEQLLSLLPQGYEALELFFDSQDWCKGKYVLRRRAGDLTSVAMLVLYPSEKEEKLPFANP